tara:strand:+ start:805 stop:1683 length:879 start_codon:yes stop_codon:yes gene_type:complete
MALQSSGAITLAQIADEFGGSTPHSLSEYYRGGSFVTSNNTSVPTSGAIDFADFYGAVKQVTAAVTSNTTNRNASTIFGSNFTTNIPKVLVINSGVEVGASNLSNYAITVPSGMAGTLTIQNAGTLSGAGGDGSSSGAGGAGGTAIYIASNNVTVTNTGTIRGGGGGGGKGANGASNVDSNFSCIGGTGGAGGNGQGYDQSQSNGAGGGARYAYLTYNPGAGNCAGPSCYFCDDQGIYTNGSSGGNGGTYGNAGSQGGGGGSAGGAAGKYIQLASGISYTLSNSGTLQGNAP